MQCYRCCHLRFQLVWPVPSYSRAAPALSGGRGRNLCDDVDSMGSTMQRLEKRCSEIIQLRPAEVQQVELISLLHDFGRTQLAATHCAISVASLLIPSLVEASAQSLVAITRACAAARASDASLLEALGRRTVELVDGAILEPHEVVVLASAFGQLSKRGKQCGAPAPPLDGQSSICLRNTLEGHLVRHVDRLSLGELAASLSGLAALGCQAERLLPVARPHIVALVRKAAAGHEFETRDAVRLIAAYSRLNACDKITLDAVTKGIRTSCARGRPVPAEFLPSLIRSLTSQLGPPPAALAEVVEASLPSVVGSFGIPELVLVVPALAFIPGLRGGRGRFGHIVFGACLSAPLTSLRPRALVGVLRSAWALSYMDIDFWAPALREAETAITTRGSSALHWSTDNLAGVGLIASNVIHRAKSFESSLASGTANSDVNSAIWAENSGPPLRAIVPAAQRFLRALAACAGPRIPEFAPRDISILAISLAKAELEDGCLFGLISYRALELLRSASAVFGSRDVAQLLAAFATFGYRDGDLLRALATRVEDDFGSYDKVAKDIVLGSFSELGSDTSMFPPGGLLLEAMVEFELSRGRRTERTEPHLQFSEVPPAAMEGCSPHLHTDLAS